MGVYMMSKGILEFIPKNQNFGFDDLVLNLLKEKINPKIFRFDGKWFDIGRPDDYEKVCNLDGNFYD